MRKPYIQPSLMTMSFNCRHLMATSPNSLEGYSEGGSFTPTTTNDQSQTTPSSEPQNIKENFFEMEWVWLLLFMLAFSLRASSQAVRLYKGGEVVYEGVGIDSITFLSPNDPTLRLPMTFTATHESSALTRAPRRVAMSGGGTTVWQTGDLLTVVGLDYDPSSGETNATYDKYTLSSGEGTSSGTFSGTSSASASTFYALTSWQNQVTIDTESSTLQHVIIPVNQTATTGSFDPAAAQEVGYTTRSEASFNFKNICALLRFTIPDGVDCTSIDISARDGSPLAGAITLNYNAGAPTFTIEHGSRQVTLTGTLTAGTTYYVAVLPGTYSAGFSVTVYNGTNCVTNSYTSSATFQRAKYYDLSSFITSPSADNDLFVDMGYTQTIGGDTYEVYWAKGNLGSPCNGILAGNYYAWGETAPFGGYDASNTHGAYKAAFGMATYKWGDGSSHTLSTDNFMTRYNATDQYTTLLPADDAATLLYGADVGASIPSVDQWSQLFSQCQWELYTETADNDNTVTRGFKVKSNNSTNYILLPFTGVLNATYDQVQNTGVGYYWTSTLFTTDSYCNKAMSVQLAADNTYWDTTNSRPTEAVKIANDRSSGFAIRPIRLVKTH